MAGRPKHKWIVLHSAMAMKIPRKSGNKSLVDAYGKEIYNVRSIEPGDPVVFTTKLVDRLMEHGRGRKPRAKDFDDNEMPTYTPSEMAEESIN